MFGVKSKFVDESKSVNDAAAKGSFKSLGHAAASIGKSARKRVRTRRAGVAAPAGKTPFTHKGAYFRRAIRYHVERAKDVAKQDAVIGHRFSVVGEVGALHEFGEVQDGLDYPVRPTMGPALEEALPRLPSEWAGTIGK